MDEAALDLGSGHPVLLADSSGVDIPVFEDEHNPRLVVRRGETDINHVSAEDGVQTDITTPPKIRTVRRHWESLDDIILQANTIVLPPNNPPEFGTLQTFYVKKSAQIHSTLRELCGRIMFTKERLLKRYTNLCCKIEQPSQMTYQIGRDAHDVPHKVVITASEWRVPEFGAAYHLNRAGGSDLSFEDVFPLQVNKVPIEIYFPAQVALEPSDISVETSVSSVIQ
ncbi:hypothetical protein BDN72DRAFT_900882 [Pluteus cervinus]|uniref:Uncharacterized protein n=1 Tax=Pluteus cervinus TaxID=181527 RepID=A0ACD3AHW7_9AGAR|nr:hypothetical protein BDN72DRAFT_900882 [Pluteus cervinus]